MNWNRAARRALPALLALIFSAAAALQPVQSHGYLVRAIPADRAVLNRAPARLQYWFSEPLEARFSVIRLRNAAGELLAEGSVSENDNSLLNLRVPAALPDGAYVVELRPAFASDGHVVAESRVFTVGSASEQLAGASAPATVIPLEAIWRALTLLGTLTLFGASSLYGAVLLPAWGNPRHRAGYLPPRVMRRLYAIAAVALFLAIGGNLLALLQQTMAFFQADAANVLQEGLWRFVRIGTRFGDIWNPRLLLLLGGASLLLASWHYGRAGRPQPQVVYPSWLATSWLLALILGTHSALSHAAGALFWAWPALLVDWLHFLAVAYWVGGLATLALVLPVALGPLSGETRREATLAVLRQFSRRLAPVVALVIATGIYSAATQLTAPSDIARTPYGQTLALKLLLVCSLLALAAAQRLASNPERADRWARRWRWLLAIRAEFILAGVILLAAATLSGTPIPTPAGAGAGYEAQRASQTVGAYTITQSITPGWTGINSFDTALDIASGQLETGQALPAIHLQAVQPARDWRSEWFAAEYIGEGLYVSASDALQEAGEWWLLLEIRAADGQTTRAAWRWDILAEAELAAVRRPSALHGLALLAVVAVLLWLLWPALRRQAALVDWRPLNVLVAIGISAITAGLLYLGYVALVRSGDEYREQLQPTPLIINDQLPMQASLARGAELYQQHCLTWQSVGRDFERLRDGADQLRDEALFAATRDGWRALPPCAASLNDEQRWHIVNYFRTLSRRNSSP